MNFSALRMLAALVTASSLLFLSCASTQKKSFAKSTTKQTFEDLIATAPAKSNLPSRFPAGSDDPTFQNETDRKEAIKNASIFSSDQNSDEELDLISWMTDSPDTVDFQQPPGGKKDEVFTNYQPVECEWIAGGKAMGGKTPKFKCGIKKINKEGVAEVDEVKVKYGADNGEIPAEIMSTRLFSALGFYADRVYPVVVRCHGCSKDPFSQTKYEQGAVRDYNPALIERKFGFKELVTVNIPKQGWTWKELDLNHNASAQLDALRLLAAFVKHGDNKAEQQRLVCPKSAMEMVQGTQHVRCSRSYLIVQDLGATMGGAGMFSGTGAKANLDNWNKTKLWKDGAKCQAQLRNSLSATDGLKDPVITEEGRRFLLWRMLELNPKQTKGLFLAAGMDDEKARLWNRAFWTKVKEMAWPTREAMSTNNFVCPTMRKASLRNSPIEANKGRMGERLAWLKSYDPNAE